MLEKVLYAKENQSGRWESHFTHMPNRLVVRREGGGCSSASFFAHFLRKNFVMGEGVILAASVGELTQLLFGRPLFCGGHASAGGARLCKGARLCGGRLFVLGFCVSGVLCVQKRGF